MESGGPPLTSGDDRVAARVRHQDANDDEDDEQVATSNAPIPLNSIWAFAGMGLLNNSPYVIMLAAAKNMAEGGVALVYLANILPGLTVKLTLPYWMERVSYNKRLFVASTLMMIAFTTVAFFSNGTNKDGPKAPNLALLGQLLGVAMVSSQCALGEASLLALAGKLDAKEGRLLTAFASGTGLAGPFGYLWKIFLTEWFGWSLQSMCLLAALVLPASYYTIYAQNLQSSAATDGNPSAYQRISQAVNTATSASRKDERSAADTYLEMSSSSHALWGTSGDEHSSKPIENDAAVVHDPLSPAAVRNDHTEQNTEEDDSFERFHDEHNNTPNEGPDPSSLPPVSELTAHQRWQRVLSLWPYIIPLFTVYAAEYACQGGVWTAIGFTDGEQARTQFYERSNWLYQVGVFFSRSSGNLFHVSMALLWILPGCQVLNLIWFYIIAAQESDWVTAWFYHPTSLYIMAFWTGLLGGAVYVHGYQRVIQDIPAPYVEFSLSTVSMAEGLGILVANIASLFLQACLYQQNDFDGAIAQCPI